MRATRSDDTILDGVFVPDRYIATGRAGRRRRNRPLRAGALRLGAAGLRQHLLWPGAPRVRHDAAVGQTKKLDRGLADDGVSRRAPAHDRRDDAGARHDRAAPGARRDRLVHRRRITARRGRRRSSAPSITRWRARGRWSIWRSRPQAGSASSGAADLEQLFRDARLGRIHPANSMLTHEIVAKTVLGISPDETPRWG